MNYNISVDKIIHQSTRLNIVRMLNAFHKATYNTIKKSLNLNDEKIGKHLRVLFKKQYVRKDWEIYDQFPCMTYSLTEYGKKRFSKYVEVMRKHVFQGV